MLRPAYQRWWNNLSWKMQTTYANKIGEKRGTISWSQVKKIFDEIYPNQKD